MSSNQEAAKKWKVAIIGSGNWGSAIASIIGENTELQPELFDQEVRMWMYEEDYEGKKLTEVFNETNENPKYLPGIKIAKGVRAYSDVVEAIEGANALVFVLPHQFIAGICSKLKDKIPKDARAISLVKGVEVTPTRINIFPHSISHHLDIPCSALSGANIANEVARREFSETTVGCVDPDDGAIWKKLFETKMFRVGLTDDVVGVSLGGALKNVVAVAAGFVDGLGWGNNAKAAVMRIGLLEMKKFSMEFFPEVRPETFVQESAGIADLITSCLGGRNKKCAEAFVTTGKSFEELEATMLNGQKLQGVQTAAEINSFLSRRRKTQDYPLFTAVYKIAYEGLKVQDLIHHI